GNLDCSPWRVEKRNQMSVQTTLLEKQVAAFLGLKQRRRPQVHSPRPSPPKPNGMRLVVLDAAEVPHRCHRYGRGQFWQDKVSKITVRACSAGHARAAVEKRLANNHG